MPKRAHPTPDPTGRRRATASSSFPKGDQLVAELKRIAAAHPLSADDKSYIVEHVGAWRRAVLGEPGPMSTEDAGAADAPSGDPTGRTSS